MVLKRPLCYAHIVLAKYESGYGEPDLGVQEQMVAYRPWMGPIQILQVPPPSLDPRQVYHEHDLVRIAIVSLVVRYVRHIVLAVDFFIAIVTSAFVMNLGLGLVEL